MVSSRNIGSGGVLVFTAAAMSSCSKSGAVKRSGLAFGYSDNDAEL